MALPLSSCEWMHISRRYKKLLELPPWFMCYSLNRLLNKQFDRRELYYITQYKTTRAIGMYVWLHNMMFLNRPITSHSIKYFNHGFYNYASHFFFCTQLSYSSWRKITQYKGKMIFHTKCVRSWSMHCYWQAWLRDCGAMHCAACTVQYWHKKKHSV